jgi:hypothetical protein
MPNPICPNRAAVNTLASEHHTVAVRDLEIARG